MCCDVLLCVVYVFVSTRSTNDSEATVATLCQAKVRLLLWLRVQTEHFLPNKIVHRGRFLIVEL